MSAQAVRGKRGSAASDKQIAFAVRDGHPVQVRLANGEHLVTLGYVIGVDDYHWVVIDHDLCTHLVHKSAPCVTILSHLSLDQDSHPNVSAIREAAAGFRERVLKDHFNQQTPAKEPLAI